MPGCLARPSPGPAVRRDRASAQPRCCGTNHRDLCCPAMRRCAIQVTGGAPAGWLVCSQGEALVLQGGFLAHFSLSRLSREQ